MIDLTERRRGLLEMIASMVIMGTVGYFVIESGLPAYDVVFFRCVFGALFLGMYCYWRGYFHNSGLTRKTLALAGLSGVFLVANWVMLFASFEFASISTSTVIYHTQPLFFVFLGTIFLGDVLTRDKLGWVLVAFIGLVMIVGPDMDGLSFSSNHLLGVFLAISAAILYAIVSIIVKQLKGIKPHLMAFIQVSVGGVLLLPLVNLTLVPTFGDVQWIYLVILGLFHTCLTYILMYSAFGKLPTSLIAVLSYIYPVVAIFVDYAAFGKTLNWMQLAGGAAILFAGYAVNQNMPIFIRSRLSVRTPK